MVTIQSVLNGGWESDEIFLPPGFLRNSWNEYLPKGSFSVLLSVMCYVFQGYSKDELIKLMIVEERELFLTPFQFEEPKNCSAEERVLYSKNLAREVEIKQILERSGHTYPQNIEEFIYLFVHVGIVLEVNHQGDVFFDILIEPFPYPEDYLSIRDKQAQMKLQTRQIDVKSAKR